MDGYLDFGSDSDNDSNGDNGNPVMEIDSDEDERNQNETILRMLLEKSDRASSKSKKEQVMQDFEAEMEAELDRRAIVVEIDGGMEHQKSISRSSSTSSLNQLALPAPAPDVKAGPSYSKRPRGIIKNQKDKGGEQPSQVKSVRFSSTEETETPSEQLGESKESKKKYENIYFDSDESEGEDDTTRKTRREKREFVSDDDLFYDPNADSRDQAWVDSKRRQYCFENKLAGSPSGREGNQSAGTRYQSKQMPNPRPLPSSDAVLNCPACFSLLTLDCQRHEFHNNQYRAMFVTNCIVKSDEIVYAPLKKGKQGGVRHKKSVDKPACPSDENDKFNPVKCKVCHSQLGFYDHDEVYHFINVLASHT